jgi:hypothetical protein
MNHGELLAHVKGHHVISAERFGRMADIHRSLSKHFEVSDPKASRLHKELAEAHQDHAEHHCQRAEMCGDGVEAKVDGAGDLEKLYKTLTT